MTIDPPPGDTLTLGFDAYIQPSSQLGHSGSVSVSWCPDGDRDPCGGPVVMGDLVQQGVTQQDYSVTSAVLAVGVFALLTLALAWANARFPRVRGVTHGVPVIIVRDGIPDLQRLRTERMSLDDLMADARQKGIRRFDEIELAVLETNGRVSFFTRAGGAGEGAPEQPGIA